MVIPFITVRSIQQGLRHSSQQRRNGSQSVPGSSASDRQAGEGLKIITFVSVLESCDLTLVMQLERLRCTCGPSHRYHRCRDPSGRLRKYFTGKISMTEVSLL